MTDIDFQAAKAAARKKRVATEPEPSSWESSEAVTPQKIDSEPHRAFPTAVLPPQLRNWASDAAVFNQVPTTMPAVFALMAAMTAAVHLTVKIRDGWEEPTVWQALLIASPSERKSPVFSAAFRPVFEQQREIKEKHARDCKAIQDRIDAQSVDADGQEAPAKSGSPAAKEIQRLKKMLAELGSPRRLIAEDVTPEEFVRLLSENNGTMSLISDEGDVFQSFGGRYSKNEPKLSPLLKGWDARMPLLYDRVGGNGGKQRTNIIVENPRASIAVAGQHMVLDYLRSQPAFRQKGLMGRLCYVVLGERKKTRMLCPVGIERDVRDAYGLAVKKVYQIDPEAPLLLKNRVFYENGWNVPKWLQDLRQRVEVGLLPGGEFDDLPDWAGKLVSNMARVAAVLEAMGGGGEEPLAELADFFISHAKRALVQVGSDAPARGTIGEETEYVLGKLREKCGPLHNRNNLLVSRPFTMRHALRACARYRTKGVEEFSLTIDLLVRLGHLNELTNTDSMHIGARGQARRFELVIALGSELEPNPEEAIPTHTGVRARMDDAWSDSFEEPEVDLSSYDDPPVFPVDKRTL